LPVSCNLVETAAVLFFRTVYLKRKFTNPVTWIENKWSYSQNQFKKFKIKTMDGGEVLIPITIFAGGFAMIFGIVYLKTKENLAMVEKGMNPKDKVHRPAPFRSLKAGLLLLGSGVGLFLAYMLDEFLIKARTVTENYHHHDENPALYFSLIGIGGGLGLVISYLIEKKSWYDKNDN